MDNFIEDLKINLKSKVESEEISEIESNKVFNDMTRNYYNGSMIYGDSKIKDKISISSSILDDLLKQRKKNKNKLMKKSNDEYIGRKK